MSPDDASPTPVYENDERPEAALSPHAAAEDDDPPEHGTDEEVDG